MISFGATPDIIAEFNTYEALFWLVVSVGLLLSVKYLNHKYARWLLFSAANIFLFGLSDIVEVYTGGFLHTARWLLYWKSVHVTGLFASIVWYFVLRLRK